jgi:bifunctional DNA-binding transcriptional regulator/antitoxin component of YhaV-PrlF toxin-antitoxin module
MAILYSQVSTKAQMVIPVELREALDLKGGHEGGATVGGQDHLAATDHGRFHTHSLVA